MGPWKTSGFDSKILFSQPSPKHNFVDITDILLIWEKSFIDPGCLTTRNFVSLVSISGQINKCSIAHCSKRLETPGQNSFFLDFVFFGLNIVDINKKNSVKKFFVTVWGPQIKFERFMSFFLLVSSYHPGQN